MNILNLFDKYFLIMMLILGLIAILHDGRKLNYEGKKAAGKKVIILGFVVIIASLILYMAKSLLT